MRPEWSYDSESCEHNLYLGQVCVGYVEYGSHDNAGDGKISFVGRTVMGREIDDTTRYSTLNSAKKGVQRKVLNKLARMHLDTSILVDWRHYVC